MALNHARLPVPPLALDYTLNLGKAVLSVAQGLSLLMGSPPALQMAFPATISNSVENRIGSAFGSVILVVPFVSAVEEIAGQC
jgi:hypothetical protein